MIIRITTTTPTVAPPIIIPIGKDDDDEVVTTTQSAELNESSIAGQLGSTSRVTAATDIDGEDCTQLVISSTTSSAVITESCKETLALNTTVSTKFPIDPRQLKVSLMILNVQEHLDVISSISCDIMSSNFCLCLSSYIV